MSKQILEIIDNRRLSNSKPGSRKDNFKLGLCIEGGGMRGVVTTGGVNALHRLGLTGVFDVVYGASSGAYNGAALLSGVPQEAAKIYLDYLPSHNFIDYWRLIRGGALFDID